MQVAVLTKDSERLAAENNHLHLRIIQETEKHKAQDREHLTRLRKLEDTVAELNFYKSSSAERHAALEKENAGLRAKTQELLHDLDAYQQIEGRSYPWKPPVRSGLLSRQLVSSTITLNCSTPFLILMPTSNPHANYTEIWCMYKADEYHLTC